MITEALGTKRTYETVRVKFKDFRPADQVDWSGRPVSPSEATETNVIGRAALEFRGLSQDFEVYGRIGQKGFDRNRLEAKVRAAIVAGLPSRVVVDFFRTTDITAKPEDPELTAWEADSKLDDIHAPHLEAQAKAGNAAADEWRAAIEDVISGLQDGYEFHRAKIHDGFRFIERCHEAANNGLMYSWCEEKLAYIRRDLAKLSTYQSSFHQNAVKRADEIQGLLRTWPVVNCWREQPPRRPAKPQGRSY